MSLIDNNLKILENRIASACQKYDRQRNEITLVAVTKTIAPDEVNTVVSSGIRNLGENKIQEAESKIPLIDKTGEPITWHMIGHLQTNKVRKAIRLFDIIESVDSLKIARAINEAAAQEGITGLILLEVNSSGEPSKYGLEPERVIPMAKEIKRMENLQIAGLMTIGPFTDEVGQIEKAFLSTRDMFFKLKDELGEKIKILSMGMSADLEFAVKYGSTELRIGTAIFGPRASYDAWHPAN
jgi:PLP dependent protein